MLCSVKAMPTEYLYELCDENQFREACRRFIVRCESENTFSSILTTIRLKLLESWRSTPGHEKILSQDGHLNIRPVLRDVNEVERIARLLELFTYFSTQTLENKKLYTGALIFDSVAQINEYVQLYHSPMLVRLSSPANLLELPREDAYEIMQLSDGRETVALCDTFGNLYGIHQTVFDPMRSKELGPIGIRSDRHGRVSLYLGGKSLFCFNGFEWQADKFEPDLIACAQAVQLNGIEDLAVPGSLFLHLLELRHSSIICLCNESDFSRVQKDGAISSMRPELNSAEFVHDEISRGCLPVLRLDGVHFFSFSSEILAIAQRVKVPSETTVATGSGTNAASHLSKELGSLAIVIKVSSDGRLKCFVNGQKMNGSSEEVFKYFNYMNKPSRFDEVTI